MAASSIGSTTQALVLIVGLLLATFAGCSGGDEILGDMIGFGGSAGSAGEGQGGSILNLDGSPGPDVVDRPPR